MNGTSANVAVKIGVAVSPCATAEGAACSSLRVVPNSIMVCLGVRGLV